MTGSVGLKSKHLAARQGPATREMLLHEGVGTPLKFKLLWPLSRIRDSQKKDVPMIISL